jgi:hypothetical protein
MCIAFPLLEDSPTEFLYTHLTITDWRLRLTLHVTPPRILGEH